MKTTFSASVVVVALMAGCSTMPNPFTVQPPSVTKISSTKYRIEFAVKDENEGGAILEKQARSVCKRGRYEVDSYDTQYLPMLYTVIKATIACK